MRIEPVHLWLAGIEIRPNIMTEVGDVIDYHVHDRPHLTQAVAGKFLERHSGKILASLTCGRNLVDRRMVIEAGVRHSFEVLELENGIAALECLWPGGIVK